MKQIFKRTNIVIFAVFALFTLLANATAEHGLDRSDRRLQTDGSECRNLLRGCL